MDNIFGIWGSYGLKQGNPLKKWNLLIKYYFSWLLIYYFHRLIKQVIKGKNFIIHRERYFGHWGSYGLKQGNLFQKFQITNQTLYVVFLLLFFCYIRVSNNGGSYSRCNWTRIIKIYFSCFIFCYFLFISKILSKEISLFILGKTYVVHWGRSGLK